MLKCLQINNQTDPRENLLEKKRKSQPWHINSSSYGNEIGCLPTTNTTKIMNFKIFPNFFGSFFSLENWNQNRRVKPVILMRKRFFRIQLRWGHCDPFFKRSMIAWWSKMIKNVPIFPSVNLKYSSSCLSLPYSLPYSLYNFCGFEQKTKIVAIKWKRSIIFKMSSSFLHYLIHHIKRVVVGTLNFIIHTGCPNKFWIETLFKKIRQIEGRSALQTFTNFFGIL